MAGKQDIEVQLQKILEQGHGLDSAVLVEREMLQEAKHEIHTLRKHVARLQQQNASLTRQLFEARRLLQERGQTIRRLQNVLRKWRNRKSAAQHRALKKLNPRNPPKGLAGMLNFGSSSTLKVKAK